MNRRGFLRLAAGGAGLTLSACASRGRSTPPCRWTMAEFSRVRDFGAREVFRIGAASAPSVVLLHELPGLSDETFALAKCLHDHKLTVYLPLLFGSAGQDSVARGYIQACVRGDFPCSASSVTPPAVTWLESICRRASEWSGTPVGVIGMGLTGTVPLALLRERSVGAAVVCQPTAPFSVILRRPNDDQKTDLGISGKDLAEALKSDVSLLALRYTRDARCPDDRMQRLEDTFKERVAVARIDGDRPDRHSTLAGDFNGNAFADTVSYLKVRLGVDPGPTAMQIAKLRGGLACEITPHGRWRTL